MRWTQGASQLHGPVSYNPECMTAKAAYQWAGSTERWSADDRTSLALTHLERGFHSSGRADLHLTQSAQLDLTKEHQAMTRALAHWAAEPNQHRQASKTPAFPPEFHQKASREERRDGAAQHRQQRQLPFWGIFQYSLCLRCQSWARVWKRAVKRHRQSRQRFARRSKAAK